MGRRHRIQNPIAKAVIGLAFFGFFLLAGIFVVGKAVHDLPLAIASSRWPVAEGIVTESSVKLMRKHRKRHRIRYEYEVAGDVYEGKRVAFMGNVFAGGKKRYKRYPAGTPLTVSYHPDDPGLAVIEPGVRVRGFVGAVVIAGLFIPLGVWGVRVSLRS